MSSFTPEHALIGTRATSSGQHLLMPNRVPADRARQTIFVEVSSRDRNYLQKVPSNPMRYQFARPLKDIRQVDLISGTIPANPYNVVDGANAFIFQEVCGGNIEQWQITLVPGVYTLQLLTYKLESLLNVLGGSNTYTVSLTGGGHLKVERETGCACFSFLFFSGVPSDEIDRSDGYLLKQNTPAFQLGFDMSDYSDISGELISPYPIDLSASINRIYLFINFDNSKDLGIIERGAGRRSPFAIIYLDEDKNGYKYLNKETTTPISFSCPQPISRLQNLNIEFRDEWHRLVNFNGKDFSLLLQITTLE